LLRWRTITLLIGAMTVPPAALQMVACGPYAGVAGAGRPGVHHAHKHAVFSCLLAASRIAASMPVGRTEAARVSALEI
jgi:acetoin utilization deacetylase AcuC-like enzyme